MIRKWTSPYQRIIVKDVDLTNVQEIRVTFRQGNKILTFDSFEMDSDGTDTTLGISLTQEQTAMFNATHVDVQVNWVIGGHRYASNIAPAMIRPNLLEELIEEGVK